MNNSIQFLHAFVQNTQNLENGREDKNERR